MWLRTLIFRIVFYAASTIIVLAAPLLAAISSKAMIWNVNLWVRLHDWCQRHILGISARVVGELPAAPVIIAMKHEAMYETLQSVLLLDRPAPVLKEELARLPGWGWAAKRYGCIPVERDAGAPALRRLIAACKAAAADGRAILIWPEGTRVPHGQTPELKPGLAGLYRMLKMPVVPIACDSGRLLPRRGAKRPGVVTFQVGEPIPPGLEREAFEARVHAAINALNREEDHA